MRRFLALLLGLALGAMILCPIHVPKAMAAGTVDNPAGDEGLMRLPLRHAPRYRAGFQTAAASTVWYGFLASSSDPNKVHVGGKWDFDTPYYAANISDTDSTQFWTFLQGPQASDAAQYTTPTLRPFWYYDYGNNINIGNHALNVARGSAGRIHRRLGLAGVWHQDNLTTVPDTGTVSPGFATNINGSGSAWCGLRLTGDANAPVDPYTGNAYTSDLQYNDNRNPGNTVRSAYPGYAAQWDQLMYRDFPYSSGSPGTVALTYRAELNNTGTSDPGGAGWFTPDPFDPANLVQGAGAAEPVDSFEVWVGAPKESGVYDSVHRYLSDTIDFGLGGAGAPALIFSTTGVVSGSISPAIPGGKSWSTVRVVFRVKTNRAFDDRVPSASGLGWNSTTGAVVIDDVNVNGNLSDFNTSSQVKPRFSGIDSGGGNVAYVENSPSASWITTGRSVAAYGHIHNSNDLPFADPCSKLFCNLSENILVQSNHDPEGSNPAHTFHKESQNWSYSPVICLNDVSPRGIAQGTPAGFRAAITGTDLQFDFYSGFDDIGLSGVLFFYALRSMASPSATPTADKQQMGPKAPAWVSSTRGGIYNYGTPTCQVTDSPPNDLDPFIDLANADSVQVELENQTRCERFASTACGASDGTYWDNIRMGFITGAGASKPAIGVSPWDRLQDTFPFNEAVSPGSVGFDTTTALVNTALNNARSAGGEGVITGDSLIAQSSFAGGDARVDLVFRIKPGPGNYSTKGNMASALWKVPSNPGLGTAAAGDGSFWGQYMKQTGEKNGEVGSAQGHTATRWDPQTWNSARMDSAQTLGETYPLVSRGVGIPLANQFQSTYHESDPKGGADPNGDGSDADHGPLSKIRNLCYLVVPTGPLDQTNICCDVAHCAALGGASYPPAGYPAGTTTYEGTKILPDGLFTPGTHVSYFVRRSKQSAPLVLENMSPDTTIVAYQPNLSDGDFDYLRYDSFDVLPDLWKSLSYGGSGLACILFVDAGDRRGGEPDVIGALDSLGYGSDNGADRGWKAVAGPANPDNPAGFVPVNLGAMGTAYDKWDNKAAESSEAGRLGGRLVGGGIDAGVADRQSKQGPTVAMLDHYYNTIIWDSYDESNSNAAMHDGSGVGGQQSDDAGIINQWLDLAGSGNEKAFWANGDGVAEDMNDSGTPSMTTLLGRMGGLFVQDNYFDFTGNHQATMVFKPQSVTGDKFHASRRYGISNSCLNVLDIIDADGSVAGAERAARYEDTSDRGSGSAGPFYSSVYRRLDAGAGRFYTTLLDGFAFDRLRGWDGTATGSPIGPQLATNNYGRRAWMQDALNAFNLCARINPVIGVGDVPGLALNFVKGAFPNPSPAGAATVQFSLAQPSKVTIRFYNVAGRLVHEATVNGAVGGNVYRWDGTTASGAKASSGVYFYRLSAPGVQFQNNSQRMVLLGQAGN